MKKLSVNHFEDMEKLQNEKKRTAVALSKEEKVLKYMRKHEIPMEALAMYPARFQRWFTTNKLCDGCLGLDQCKQKQVGIREGLYYDGALSYTLEDCPYTIKKKEETKHLKQYLVNDLGEMYHLVTFKKTDIQNEKIEYLAAYHEALEAYNNQTGLYIYGNIGSGKTYLAACCCNQMALDGKTVGFVHMPTFVKRLEDIYQRKYAFSDFDEIDFLGFADFVVFDDIGAEHVNEYNRSILLSILEKRMQNNRMTWFTSNEDFESLLSHYTQTVFSADEIEGQRVLERIYVLAKPLKLMGEDRRKLQKKDIK